MSTDSAELVTARKKNIRGDHKVHLRINFWHELLIARY